LQNQHPGTSGGHRIGSAALGLLASLAGLGSVFLAATLAVLGSAIFALRLLASPKSR